MMADGRAVRAAPTPTLPRNTGRGSERERGPRCGPYVSDVVNRPMVVRRLRGGGRIGLRASRLHVRGGLVGEKETGISHILARGTLLEKCMGHLLGIDIGTSGTKTLICDEKGKVLATAMAEHAIYSPRPGWSEQE